MIDISKSQEVLTMEDRAGVRIIRMNRPDKMNALNGALTSALLTALEAVDADESVRAVVLAGAGRSFCAGADLLEFDELVSRNHDLVAKRADLTCKLQSILQRLSKPIVSAVQGYAVGGGAGLAIGCDMVVAGTSLKLGYPELRHSIVPAIVMTGLQRQLGRKIAFELVSLGRLLSSDDAFSLGLANRVVPDERVIDVALEIASEWSKTNAAAMAAAKQLFYRVADLPFEAAMAAGRDINVIMRSFRSHEQRA